MYKLKTTSLKYLLSTAEPRYNEPLCYKSPVKRTIFFTPVIVKYMTKNLDISKTRYSEQILPVSWHIVVSRFHCSRIGLFRKWQLPIML